MKYKHEDINPYDKQGDKGQIVEQMFDNIALTYDTLNDRLSFNIHKYWRKSALNRLKNAPCQNLLDVATGTGDFAILAAKMLNVKQIVGVDFSKQMLEIGYKKVINEHLEKIITLRKEDCMALSFNDNSFDTVLVSFGIRNFKDLHLGLSEIYRVMTTGGRLCVLELTQPRSFPMNKLFTLYSHYLLPLYAKLISGDKKAYQYLTSTMEAFPDDKTMKIIFKEIGFKDIDIKHMTFGICTIYLVIK